MSLDAPSQRRARRCVAIALASVLTGGCGSTSWRWALTERCIEHGPLGSASIGTASEEAGGVVIALAANVVLIVGAAAADVIGNLVHDFEVWREPGVAYDSPEGLALRIPNFPVGNQNENGSSTLGR